MTYIPLDRPLPLLAEHARTARHHGTCAHCHHPILPGQRQADLPDGGGTVHASCANPKDTRT